MQQKGSLQSVPNTDLTQLVISGPMSSSAVVLPLGYCPQPGDMEMELGGRKPTFLSGDVFA